MRYAENMDKKNRIFPGHRKRNLSSSYFHIGYEASPKKKYFFTNSIGIAEGKISISIFLSGMLHSQYENKKKKDSAYGDQEITCFSYPYFLHISLFI